MLKVTVLAVGKLKERFWKDACSEYLKRLGGYAQVNVIEVADSAPDKEEQLIVAQLDKLGNAHIALMDIQGTETSSTQLASKLDSLATAGTSHVVFIIGGSDGVTSVIRSRCNERISFGPITLPHNLARVVLLEQIYRAFKIQRGEPYHK